MQKIRFMGALSAFLSFNMAFAAVQSKVNIKADSWLEYHQVAPGDQGDFAMGSVVSTGHIKNLARNYDSDKFLISFDDGYRSVFDYAYPILKAAKIPALVSIIRGTIRGSGLPEDKQTTMSADEIYELYQQGWGIAFHAHSAAEHNFNYKRFAEVLQYGITKNADTELDIENSQSRVQKLARLTQFTSLAGVSNEELLDRLVKGRSDVLELIKSDSDLNAESSAIQVLSKILYEEREELALLVGTDLGDITIFVYPHSESNKVLRAATKKAGFVRGVAGGPLGDSDDYFNYPRKWMNDATDLPL